MKLSDELVPSGGTTILSFLNTFLNIFKYFLNIYGND